MDSLQKSRLTGWFIFGILTGLMFGCFVSVFAYGFWNSIVPPERQRSRIRRADYQLSSAKGDLFDARNELATPGPHELSPTDGFWHMEYVGEHYAVVPVVGHHTDAGGELFAITDHPGYPTLRIRFIYRSTGYETVILGTYGFEERR